MYVPPAEFVVYETTHWLVNQCVDATLPGYLIVSARDPHATRLADLPAAARRDLGLVLARVDEALDAVLSPVRVYFCRWGHTPHQTVHFHAIPVFDWIEATAAQDERYQPLLHYHGERQDERAGAFDGADLMLYVVREYLEGHAPPPCEGSTTEEAVLQLRAYMAREPA